MNDNTNKISNILRQIQLLKDKYDELAAVTGQIKSDSYTFYTSLTPVPVYKCCVPGIPCLWNSIVCSCLML